MAEGFYPGSSRRRKAHVDEPEPVVVQEDEFILGKSKTFLVQGQPVEFYYIGDVARALNREAVTIRKMENHGDLPLSPYMSPGIDDRGKRRLYTKQQIEALRRIAQEEGVLYPSAKGKWKPIAQTNFTQKVKEAFRSMSV